MTVRSIHSVSQQRKNIKTGGIISLFGEKIIKNRLFFLDFL